MNCSLCLLPQYSTSRLIISGTGILVLATVSLALASLVAFVAFLGKPRGKNVVTNWRDCCEIV